MRLDSITVREVVGAVGTELEVVCVGHTTGQLSTDEALGCVASWLYGKKRTEINAPQFMRSYLQDARQRRRYGQPLYEEHILALNEAGESRHRCEACKGKGGGADGSGWGTCCACLGKGFVG